MTAEHLVMTLLIAANGLYVAWSMARIITASRAIAQMVRELHNR